MHRKSIFATLATAAIPLASAQISGLDISAGCIASLSTSLLIPGVARCLSITGLLPALTRSSDESLVPVIADYEKQVCAAPTCSDFSVNSVVKLVLSGCASDLEKAGLNSDVRDLIDDNATRGYKVVKDVICLRNATESQDASRGSCSDGSVFCLQDLLNNLESDLNVTLSTSFLGGLLSQLGDVSGTDILQVVGGLPTTTACSECVSAAYNLVDEEFNVSNISLGGITLSQGVSLKCGPNFTTAPFPASVEQYSDYCPDSGRGLFGGIFRRWA